MNLRAQAIHGMALLAAASLAPAAPLGYVVNSDSPAASDFDALYQVDLATGDATLIGPTGYGDVEGLALSPDGVLYGIDDNTKTLIVIDTDTGLGQPVGGMDGNTGLPTGLENARDFGLSFDAEGQLWLSSDVTGEIWRVDPDTGALTLASGSATTTSTSGSDGSKSAADPGALTALAGCGGWVYGIGSQGDERLYRFPAVGGDPTLVGALEAGLAFDDGGLGFAGDGVLWGIADQATLVVGGDTQILNDPSIIFTVNTQTGAATSVDTTLIGVESLAIAPPLATCAGLVGSAPAIPTVNTAGVAALALSLIALACLALRQRAGHVAR